MEEVNLHAGGREPVPEHLPRLEGAERVGEDADGHMPPGGGLEEIGEGPPGRVVLASLRMYDSRRISSCAAAMASSIAAKASSPFA